MELMADYFMGHPLDHMIVYILVSLIDEQMTRRLNNLHLNQYKNIKVFRPVVTTFISDSEISFRGL